MTEVAVLNDWQRAARGCADWSKLRRAEVTFFSEAFGEDDAASRLAEFDILLMMRQPLPGSLIERLPRLGMITASEPRRPFLKGPGSAAR